PNAPMRSARVVSRVTRITDSSEVGVVLRPQVRQPHKGKTTRASLAATLRMLAVTTRPTIPRGRKTERAARLPRRPARPSRFVELELQAKRQEVAPGRLVVRLAACVAERGARLEHEDAVAVVHDRARRVERDQLVVVRDVD